MKKFFNIESGYKFEWNDLRCFITIINVVLVMIYGLSISWFGLAVAVVGIIKDLTTDRRINGLLMHIANMSLNIYFLLMFYGVVLNYHYPAGQKFFKKPIDKLKRLCYN